MEARQSPSLLGNGVMGAFVAVGQGVFSAKDHVYRVGQNINFEGVLIIYSIAVCWFFFFFSLANTHLSAKIKLKAHPQTEAACTFVFIFM